MNLKLIKLGTFCDIYRNDSYPGLIFLNRKDNFFANGTIFPEKIKNKGIIFNQLSIRWMNLFESLQIISNHLISTTAKGLIMYNVDSSFAGSIVAATYCIPIPLKCIVKGYYTSDLKNNTSSKIDCIDTLILEESEKLPSPIYIPETKFSTHKNRSNSISFEESTEFLKIFLKENFTLHDGADYSSVAYELAEQLKFYSLRIYSIAHHYALRRGIIIADTKLEYGFCQNPISKEWQIVLIGEVITPDNSSFWDVSTYKIGKCQKSMDKKILSKELNWDGQSISPKISDRKKIKLLNIYSSILEKLFDTNINDLISEIELDWKISF